MIRAALGALALVVSSTAAAQEAAPHDGNREMAAMFAADQQARMDPAADWAAISAEDATRRARTRELLDAGALTTGPDHYAAAFVFQHGDRPEDYHLAHALAMRALGLGMKRAEWIAAASLDRYLHSLDRDQIYGTQYQAAEGEAWTQGLYDPVLLPDALRAGAGVETVAEQQAHLLRMNASAPAHEH